MGIDAIVCDADDTVATALRQLAPGERVRVAIGAAEAVLELELRDAVPFGHKFALRDMPAGDKVIKYGETIGLASVPIMRGEHVHLHNVEGLRGRGDLR